jgi:hypothetical protein
MIHGIFVLVKIHGIFVLVKETDLTHALKRQHHCRLSAYLKTCATHALKEAEVLQQHALRCRTQGARCLFTRRQAYATRRGMKHLLPL